MTLTLATSRMAGNTAKANNKSYGLTTADEEYLITQLNNTTGTTSGRKLRRLRKIRSTQDSIRR